MALNPNIILAQQQIDVAGAIGRGQQIGQQANQIAQQNYLARFTRDHGDKVAAGNQNYLAKFAQIAGPEAALGIEQTHLGMDSTRQQMRIREEQLALSKAAGARAAQSLRMQIQAAKSAEEKQAFAAQAQSELEKGQQMVRQFAAAVEAGDAAAMSMIGREFGMDGATADDLPMIAAAVEGGLGEIENFRKAFPVQSPTPPKVDLPDGSYLADPNDPSSINFYDDPRPKTSLVTVQTPGAAPTPKQGYRNVFDESNNFVGQEAIPGGPADTSKEDSLREGQKQKYASTVADNAAKLREKVLNNFGTTGLVGTIARRIPGSDAFDAQALTDTLKANIGFDRLQEMREASPTGGALGQVSNMEIKFLQSTLANLDLAQSQEQFLSQLSKVEEAYFDIIHGEGNWRLGANGEVTTTSAGTIEIDGYTIEVID